MRGREKNNRARGEIKALVDMKNGKLIRDLVIDFLIILKFSTALLEHESVVRFTSLADHGTSIKILRVQTSDDFLTVYTQYEEKYPLEIDVTAPDRNFTVKFLPLFAKFVAAHIFFEIEISKNNSTMDHFYFVYNITSRVETFFFK